MTGSKRNGAGDRRRLGLAAGCGALALLLLSACGAGSNRPDSQAANVDETAISPNLTALLRATSGFDFEPAETPADLADRVDVAVVGSVQSSKLVAIRDEGETTGGVVVTLRIEDSWKAVPANQGTVDVILRWPQNLDLTAFERDLPFGSRVAFFGYEVELPVIDRPAGAPTLHDPHPQGLMFVGPTGDLVNVWGEDVMVNEQWRRVTSLKTLSEAIGDPR